MSKKWIEALFERLIAYHGTPFLNQFAGDLERVKQVWEQELGQFDLQIIKEALDIVKSSDEPPTLQRMVSVCRQRAQARPAPTPVLPPPPPAEARKRRADQLQTLRFGRPSSDWAVKLLDEVAAGVVLPRMSEQFAVEALLNTGRENDLPAAYIEARRPVYMNLMEERHGKA